MRAGMSYFHETIWNGLPKFLRRVDTALRSIGINERLPYNVPLIQFSSWMGGDRDGQFSQPSSLHPLFFVPGSSNLEHGLVHCFFVNLTVKYYNSEFF